MNHLSRPKEETSVLLLEGIHPSAADVFHHHGYRQVRSLSASPKEEELIEALRGVHFLGIRSRTQLTQSILDAADSLMGVGCFCIGTNQVDLSAAAFQGIPVFNAPHSNTRSVAELVIAWTIMLFRQTLEKSVAAHQGQWLKSAQNCHEVRGKHIGIIGYGHIGSQVSILAESLGMQVGYYDIVNKLPLGNAKPYSCLESLLEDSDVVTLHVPETSLTHEMINPKTIEYMKPGALLLNASRGSVVDLNAVKLALESGFLGGVALDVFPEEPESTKDSFSSPLQGNYRAILTPHIGGSTQEAQANIGREVAEHLVRFSDQGSTEGAVNFPQLTLPVQAKDCHRILHMHKNTPGMLQQINKCLADDDINVLGQYLLTNPEVGYVVLDISKDASEKLLKSLKDIEGTLRARVLY